MADTVLAKQDVYPLAFNYYIDKADAILDVPGAPNFDEVKTYLETALSYAFNQELRNIAYARLNNIDLLILMYKADVAESRKTIDSLEAGLAYLSEAKNLATDLQVQQIDQKIEAFGATLASLKAAQAEAEQLEADRQQLEQAEAVHQE
jgi:colicin import membrane protein